MNGHETPEASICSCASTVLAQPMPCQPPKHERRSHRDKSVDGLDWRWQMRNRVMTAGELACRLPGVSNLDAINRVALKYPMAISPYYLSLIQSPDASDPIFSQCVPQPQELESPTFCVPDPLEEETHSPVPGLVHRYRDRALSLVSSTCANYCRHCTRKRLAGVKERFATSAVLADQVSYLRAHPEIDDLVISGGDPLTMTTARLDRALAAFRSVPSVQVIRIGTRAPVTMPMRITDTLCSMLDKHHPLWVCTHFNHPREVTPEAAQACDKLLRVGIPIMNQSVLLRGVNDRTETMIDLLKSLIAIRVRPYYLFQCDLVQGVEHFRTPLSCGTEIMEAVRGKISGIACPQFIVDAPNGAGKIPVGAQHIVSRSPAETVLRSCEGELVRYPEPVATAESR